MTPALEGDITGEARASAIPVASGTDGSPAVRCTSTCLGSANGSFHHRRA